MTFHSTLLFQATRRGCFLWLLTFFVGAGAGAAEQISVRNRALEATFSSGHLSLTSRSGQRTFFKNARLSQSRGVAMVTNIVDQRFGSGEALEITYEDGGKDSVML